MMNHTKSERKMIKRGVFYSSKISSVFLQKNFKNNLRNQKIFTIFASSKGKGWRTALRRLPDEAKRRLPEAETHDRTTT